MKAFSTISAPRLLKDRSAAAAVEYALLIALAATAFGIGLNRMSDSIGAMYRHLDSELAAPSSSVGGSAGEWNVGKGREHRNAAIANDRLPWTVDGRSAGAGFVGTGGDAGRLVAYGSHDIREVAAAGSDGGDNRIVGRGPPDMWSGDRGRQTADTATSGAANEVPTGTGGDRDADADAGASGHGDGAPSGTGVASGAGRVAGSGTPGGGGPSGPSGAGRETPGAGVPSGTRIASPSTGRIAGARFGNLGSGNARQFESATALWAERRQRIGSADQGESTGDETSLWEQDEVPTEWVTARDILLVMLSIIFGLFVFVKILRMYSSGSFDFVKRSLASRDRTAVSRGGGADRAHR